MRHFKIDVTQQIIKAQKTYSDRKRSELKESDFLFPEVCSFPIVSPQNVKDAISNFGRPNASKRKLNFKK